MTDDDIDYVLGEIRSELSSMSESRKRTVARSKQTFVQWLHTRMFEIGQAIGIIISLPVRVVTGLAEGLFEGLFGGY